MNIQTNETIEKKTISRLSEADRNAISVLRCLVPGQQMKIRGMNSEMGNWTSVCYEEEGLAITRITKNNKLVVKIIYDYDSGTEEEFYSSEESK